MVCVIAPTSCRHAAYTPGRCEKACVELGRNPRSSRSASYIAATSPVASSVGTVSMKVMAASLAARPHSSRAGSLPHMRKIQSQGVHHITRVGADRQTSIDFWEGVLGMPFVFEQPNLDNPGESHLYFDPGDGRLITIF